MNNYIQEFVDSAESLNTRKVLLHVFKKIDANNIEKYSPIQMEQLIIDSQPNSPKSITTTIYVLSSYAKWIQEQGIINDDNSLQILQSLDKKLLWQKCKKTAKKKFISYEQYGQIIKDIATFEEYNSLYYESLFSCVYHGIYSDDLSVLKNLRGSDIDDDGVIVLHEDSGHSYKLKIPERLAKDLKQLAGINTWQRPNRFSVCNVNTKGIYSDSVFKTEHRKTAVADSYKFSYYAKLRKISSEYVGHTISPLCLFASGIMHRIKVELNKNGITLEEAFADNGRNKMAYMIIEKELIRTNNRIEINNFRELIKGYLEIF